MTRSEYLAHVKQSNGTYYVHELSEHLKGTASLASIFANDFGNSDWGSLVGLWHDLGKYQADFQRRIKHHSGYDPEAHLEGSVGKVDHSTAGALYAIKKLGKLGHIVAYMIAGHHAGLTDWKSEESGQSSLAYRLEKKELLDKTLAADIPEEILNPPKPTSKPKQELDIAFWIRMLFSCLVDADFLDTENFMDDKKVNLRSGYPTLEELFEKFDRFMQNKINNSLQTPINQIRRAIFSECEAAAESDSGLFSLTVPTGGGKTLSSMAFALRHALKHKKRRIIYVIPYTSIIEQTADIFREIFADAVIEQHSNIESSKETARSRLAYENWDAPIIVTTSVQFFESLFSNRTSRVRKLHNIVESVVILDEAQLLPPDYLLPILHTIKELQQNYGVSFVICTATQPALEKRETADFSFSGLSNVKEIISEPTELHQKLKRVEVIVPQDISRQKSWQEVAQELQQYSSVLCVVNSRKDCRELFSLMPDTTIHLSALMCGQHRSEMIRYIKSLLKSGQNVRVISTQLVEAGVDLDFPVVYRALAGLDSIAQAAGRCNREGLLALGKVVLFIPPKPSPAGHLRQAEECARILLQEGSVDHLSPERFTKFFQNLYWLKGKNLDRHKILDDLRPNHELGIYFKRAAINFKIIDDSASLPLVVRYGDSPELIEKLKQKHDKHFTDRSRLRKLQRFVINIPKSLHSQLAASGEIVEINADIFPGLFVQNAGYEHLYSEKVGLLIPDLPSYQAETLIG